MVWKKGPSPDFPVSLSLPSRPEPKRMGHCTECGRKIDGYGKFCSSCGAEIIPVSRPKNSCACGTIFNQEHKFCGTCGNQNPNPVPSKLSAKRRPRS